MNLLCAAAMGMLSAPSADGVVIKSESPHYELTLPSGYGSTVPREVPARYVRSSGSEPWARISLLLVNGDKGLAQNPAGVTPGEIAPFVRLPPDAKATFIKVRWSDLDCGGYEYRAVVADLPVIGLTVVLPLKGNVLTLTAYAPDPLESELRAEFGQILSAISGTSPSWRTEAQLREIATMERIGMSGMGLLAAYLVAWSFLFRGQPLKGHWLRVLWLSAAAGLLCVPLWSPGPTTLFSNLLANAMLPLFVVMFVLRRIKLGLELD